MEMTQYQKDLVRMWDSLRENHKGESRCIAVACENCLLDECCHGDDGNISFNAEKSMEVVAQWAKEHPLVTMKDKYKEVFGVEPVHRESEIKNYLCPKLAGLGIDINCNAQPCGKCKEDFWGAEYKPPKTDKEGVSE